MRSKKNEISIDSLTKFLANIEKLPQSAMYRGENQVFQSREAACFRPYTGAWESYQPFPFMKMISEFYKETAYKLNEDKSDFIAFAQHHGIPTNLLDITTSPLTALYFACQGSTEEDGVVYVLEDAKIDVTELLHKFPNQNLIEVVFSNTAQQLNVLFPLFNQFYHENVEPFSTMICNLRKDYIYYFSSTLIAEKKHLIAAMKKKKIDWWEVSYHLRECYPELKATEIGEVDEMVYAYVLLQYAFLKDARNFTEAIHNLSFLPNFVYRPIMKFERGRNQQGLFLYQCYMTYIEPVYNYRVLSVQNVHFNNTIFRISNKTDILKSLDKIGINLKTLFCDYDSVASYIKEKFKEELK